MATVGTLRILVLAHDLSDAAVQRRVVMLCEGGAVVTVAGFRRTSEPIDNVAGCPAVDFGQTYSAGFAQRIWSVMREVALLRRHRELFINTDVIIARNLEMLAIAVRGQSICASPPALVYESLDIHRLLLGRGPIGIALRTLEGWLTEHASALITSSPAFVSSYFNSLSKVRLPIKLVENKVVRADRDVSQRPSLPARSPGPPWTIGWFGIIRCKKSLKILTDLIRQSNGAIEVVIRGRPALNEFEDFDKLTSETPGLRFLGPYKSPDDLAAIYRGVHFTWAIDMFEEGLNSSWLLPNRLYEGGLYGSVPIAVESVETGHFLKQLGIGVTVGEPLHDSLGNFFRGLTSSHYKSLEDAVQKVPEATWVYEREDCRDLVLYLCSLKKNTFLPEIVPMADSTPMAHGDNEPVRVLIVIPCLNEEERLEKLVHSLVTSNQNSPSCIVIADGGSTDRSPEIAQKLAAQYPNVKYLENPKRIQSSAVNLAVTTYGRDAKFLIRIDAHSDYPADYCQALIEEAEQTNASSVVVAMKTVGEGWFQQAVAMAQNSKLGNGDSAHRNIGKDGMWVDHGHHALMRVEAFRKIGGYDETFSYNEDAELDVRLEKAGFKIWLTGKTALDYYPRSSPLSLFRQYVGYGYGRAQNLIKHRNIPKLRQLAPAAVLPAIALFLASPMLSMAALPFDAWIILCLGYGIILGIKAESAQVAMVGPVAMIMHFGWSLGFWGGIFKKLLGRL